MSVTRIAMLLFGLWSTGSGMAGSVYRCFDDAGGVVFRQFACAAGEGERIRIEAGNRGWLRPEVRQTNAQTVRKKRDVREERVNSPRRLASRGNGDRCWKARRRVADVTRRLRQGYTRAEGERLRRRRERDQAYLERFCTEP